MFLVHDGRRKRKEAVLRFAAEDVFVGVLLAAADFEWTCRRAIQAMGYGPTEGIRIELFECGDCGIRVKKGWEKQVRQKSKGILKFEDIFSIWAKQNCASYVIWADIEHAMMWRNKLIHGVEGSIGQAEGYRCVNILECACDILVQYIAQFNVDIYAYVGRRGKLSNKATLGKSKMQQAEQTRQTSRRASKDECVISGVRIKRNIIKAELKLSAKALEHVSLQLKRKFGIGLLV